MAVLCVGHQGVRRTWPGSPASLEAGWTVLVTGTALFSPGLNTLLSDQPGLQDTLWYQGLAATLGGGGEGPTPCKEPAAGGRPCPPTGPPPSPRSHHCYSITVGLGTQILGNEDQLSGHHLHLSFLHLSSGPHVFPSGEDVWKNRRAG